MRFQQAHNLGLRQLFLDAPSTAHLSAVSAQKALQGSQSVTKELLGGTEENRVSPIGVIDLLGGRIFSKRENVNKQT